MMSKYVSREFKIRIYKTVMRHTVTYACETWLTWIMNNVEEEVLERWERKILKCIFDRKKTEKLGPIP